MVNMGEAFRFDRISNEECERVPLTMAERDRYVLRGGDLLFVRQSLKYEGAGKCIYVEVGEEPRTWESHLIRVRLDSAVADSRYYFYYFRSPSGRLSIESIVEQVAAAGIRGSDLRRLKVPHPPMLVQAAIADVLGALDDKIAVNDRIAATSHRLAEIIYEVSTKNLPKRPLSSILEPILGGTPDRAISAYWGPGNPWASAKDVAGSKFGIVLKTEEQITDLAVAQTRAKPVSKGSVILTARGTVGAVARVAQPTSFNQSCYAFMPKVLPPAILYLTICSASRRMQSIAHGTVFSTVTMKTFDHVQGPSFNAAALESLETKLSPILDTIEGRVRESQALAFLRDTLLPKLMSGEIRVREAARVVEGAT
jgi:type I restriction enzyme S subunit